MSDKLRVSESNGLLTFLITQLSGWSRSKIKQRLHAGCVIVNGQSVSQHNHVLNVGDDVEVLALVKRKKPVRDGEPPLEILYSDRDLIAINKPAGLLSVAADAKNKSHALSILRHQLSTPKHPMRLWPVHRLDRETSGVLLFATSRAMREAVSAGWSAATKTYLAVVEGHPRPPKGIIDQPLRLDPRAYRMIVGPHFEAKRAVTHFETQRTAKKRALLMLRLETGRQHQIRAHLAWLGHPVIGDARYGTPGSRMGLHALRLSITHPTTGERLTFETPPPDAFYSLLE